MQFSLEFGRLAGHKIDEEVFPRQLADKIIQIASKEIQMHELQKIVLEKKEGIYIMKISC